MSRNVQAHFRQAWTYASNMSTPVVKKGPKDHHYVVFHDWCGHIRRICPSLAKIGMDIQRYIEQLFVFWLDNVHEVFSLYPKAFQTSPGHNQGNYLIMSLKSVISEMELKRPPGHISELNKYPQRCLGLLEWAFSSLSESS